MSENSLAVEAKPVYQIQPYADKDSYELALRMANSLAKSSLVPPEFRGERGMANCLIAMEMAGRLGISPFMCVQNLFVIHERPSFSSSFLIGLVNNSGLFSGKIRFEFNEDRTACYAHAKDKETGEDLRGQEISIEMAKKAGWYDRKGSMWPLMPEQMLRYRAAAFFTRVYCPELILGMTTREEAYDIGPQEEEIYSVPGRASETREAKAEKTKKLTDEILGVSGESAESAEPVVEAELRPAEPTVITPASDENPAPPDQPALAGPAEGRRIYEAYVAEFGGNKKKAADEIRRVAGSNRPSSKWTVPDIEALAQNLGDIKEARMAREDNAAEAQAQPDTEEADAGKTPFEALMDEAAAFL